MIKYLYICFCFFGASFAQETKLVLPIVKAGNWYLYNAGSELKLPAEIQYVNLFDTDGTALFYSNSGYGILNEMGQILVPANFQSLESLGNSYYSTEDSTGAYFFQLNAGEINEKVRFDSLINFKNNWIYYQIDSLPYILNLKNKERFELMTLEKDTSNNTVNYISRSSSSRIISKYNYLFFTAKDSSQILINKKGNLLDQSKKKSSCYIITRSDFLLYKSENLCFFYDPIGEQILPKTATNLRADNSNYYYTNKGVAYCVNRETKATLSFPCSGIHAYNTQYWMIERNGKFGLIDKKGKLLLDANYTYITKGKEYWTVYDRELVGLVDTNFNLVLPVKFTNISMDSSFFKTFSYMTETYGLYYRKTAQELLPCVYDKIEIQKNNIRAWSNSNLLLLELDEKLNVTQKIILENVIPIDRRKKYKPLNFDPRLFSLGWFYDTINQKPEGEWISTKVIWGLQNEQNKLLLRPQFSKVLFVNGAPVSLTPSPDKDENGVELFTMLDWSTGKKAGKYAIYSLDTLDFMRRNFARFSSPETWGILTLDSKIEEFSYIDPTDEKFLRVCKGGKIELSVSNSVETVSILSPNANEKYYFYTTIFDKKTKKYVYYQKIKEGEWNYLDTLGNFLFEKPFLFAEPFYKGTAIVKTKSGWGVTSKDSFLIQPIYKSIKRLENYADTAFLVERNPGKTFVSTHDFELNENFTTAEKKQKNDFYLFTSKGSNKLYNSKLEIISSDLKSVYLYDHGRFATKKKKIYTLFDEKGKEISETVHKPLEFLDEDHFTANSKSKVGLIHANGDTILPFEQEFITKTGPFFYVFNNLKSTVYNENWETLVSTKKGKILIDTISNHIALVQDLKIQIYNQYGEKVGKLKTKHPAFHYHNNLFFANLSNQLVYDSTGKQVHSELEITDVQYLDKGFYCISDKDRVTHLFNEKHQEILAENSKKKKIRFVSENVICFREKNNFYLYHIETEKISKPYLEIIENYNSGFILAKENKKSSTYVFLNGEFKNEFNHYYNFAKPFQFGVATVRLSSGWTAINTQGLKKSYPSFGEIESLGNSHFLIKHRNLFGIMSSHGNEIIPCENEQIDFLNGNLVRTLISGQFAYFYKNGKIMYKP